MTLKDELRLFTKASIKIFRFNTALEKDARDVARDIVDEAEFS